MFFSQPNLLNGTPWNGMRIGLLGGSFNPPHRGHVHISQIAMKMMQLDAIWWLVTPQNPHKAASMIMPYEKRLSLSLSLVTHPRILVTDLENQLGSSYTYETVQSLRAHFPRTDFVFITGMDNALSFHKWNNWKDILDTMTTCHIARPPAQKLIQNCPLKGLNTQTHITLHRSEKVSLEPKITYWIKQRKMVFLSSTQIRNDYKTNT